MLRIQLLSVSGLACRATLAIAALTFATGCQHGLAAARTGPGTSDAPSVASGNRARTYDRPGVQTMDSADLTGVRTTRIEDLLRQFGGVQVERTSRGRISVRIRGLEPLVVVNGLEGDSHLLLTVMPQDVARIEVLKDVGETAIYGNRGLNGVIRVTTRW